MTFFPLKLLTSSKANFQLESIFIDTHSLLQMKEMFICGFCWLLTMVACIAFAVLTLISTSQITALQKAFDGNSSAIFQNFNTSLYNSIAGLEVVGSVFGAVDRFDNSTFGGFLERLRGDFSIALAVRVPRTNISEFQEGIRAEVYYHITKAFLCHVGLKTTASICA